MIQSPPKAPPPITITLEVTISTCGAIRTFSQPESAKLEFISSLNSRFRIDTPGLKNKSQTYKQIFPHQIPTLSLNLLQLEACSGEGECFSALLEFIHSPTCF